MVRGITDVVADGRVQSLLRVHVQVVQVQAVNKTGGLRSWDGPLGCVGTGLVLRARRRLRPCRSLP